MEGCGIPPSCPICEVHDIFVPFEPQMPFDYAQGRLSTPLGAKNAPNSAQDDIRFGYGFLRHHPGRKNKDAPRVGHPALVQHQAVRNLVAGGCLAYRVLATSSTVTGSRNGMLARSCLPTISTGCLASASRKAWNSLRPEFWSARKRFANSPF